MYIALLVYYCRINSFFGGLFDWKLLIDLRRLDIVGRLGCFFRFVELVDRVENLQNLRGCLAVLNHLPERVAFLLPEERTRTTILFDPALAHVDYSVHVRRSRELLRNYHYRRLIKIVSTSGRAVNIDLSTFISVSSSRDEAAVSHSMIFGLASTARAMLICCSSPKLI